MDSNSLNAWFDFMFNENNPTANFIRNNNWEECAMIDVGTNVGAYAALFEKNGGKVLAAVDPVVEVLSVAATKLRCRSYYNAGVGTVSPMYVYKDWNDSNYGLHKTSDVMSQDATIVDGIRLDTLLSHCNTASYKKVLLKIDVENSEEDVLKSGADSCVKYNVTDILIETGTPHTSVATELFETYLPEYKIETQLDNHNYHLTLK